MNIFVFSVRAKEIFTSLERSDQERILKKLEYLKTHPNIFLVLRSLQGMLPATHRLRVGSFRLIIVQQIQGKFLILDIGHRREIYR